MELDDIVTVSNPPLLMSLRNGRRVRLLLKDASAVADCIRQQKNLSAKEQKAMNSIPAPITPIIQTEDVAEQLKKFKQLENEGIITQEEFEIKKKQLINL